nr:MAG TPA: hypothetical protein [Caudoviricetes sp.]
MVLFYAYSFRVSNQCDACLKSWLDRKYIALRGDV